MNAWSSTLNVFVHPVKININVIIYKVYFYFLQLQVYVAISKVYITVANVTHISGYIQVNLITSIMKLK